MIVIFPAKFLGDRYNTNGFSRWELMVLVFKTHTHTHTHLDTKTCTCSQQEAARGHKIQNYATNFNRPAATNIRSQLPLHLARICGQVFSSWQLDEVKIKQC